MITGGWGRKEYMMPLTFAPQGKENTVVKIGGKEETRKFLERLGLIEGGKVTVVNAAEGNLILNVRDSRVAVGKEMALKILVE